VHKADNLPPSCADVKKSGGLFRPVMGQLYLYLYINTEPFEGQGSSTYIKACSTKKYRTFAIKTSFYNILSTVPFKLVPTTGDTPFPTFLPLL
jgi:hypothetical protein